MQQQLTSGRSVLVESKNSLLRIKSLWTYFHGQNLPNKSTQGTKKLDNSSEILLLCFLYSPLSPSQDEKLTPKDGGKKEWKRELGVSGHSGVWSKDIHALLSKVLRDFCFEGQEDSRYFVENKWRGNLCLIFPDRGEERGNFWVRRGSNKSMKPSQFLYTRCGWKLNSSHRTGNGQFSFQSQRKAMPKNAQATTQLHSSHMLAK